MIKMKKIALLTAMFFCCIVHSQTNTIDSLSQVFLENKMNVGVSFGILKNDSIYTYNYGSKYYKGNEDIEESTLFEIGSVSKIYTSYILASLEYEGIIHRNDKLIDFLPKSFNNGSILDPISIRHLASHTSGIPITAWDDWGKLQKEESFNENNPFDILTEDFILEKLKGVHQLTKFEEPRYSNFSYGLLSWVMTQKTGLNYSNLLSKYITTPMNLENTFSRVSQSKINEIALPHKGGNIVPLIELSDAEGTGGIKSNMNDLLSFLNALTNPKNDKEHRLQKIVFSQQFEKEGLESIGLGWGIFEYENTKVYWKNGGTYGSGSIVVVCPSQKIAVATLANSDATETIQSYAFTILKELIHKG